MPTGESPCRMSESRSNPKYPNTRPFFTFYLFVYSKRLLTISLYFRYFYYIPSGGFLVQADLDYTQLTLVQSVGNKSFTLNSRGRILTRHRSLTSTIDDFESVLSLCLLKNRLIGLEHNNPRILSGRFKTMCWRAGLDYSSFLTNHSQVVRELNKPAYRQETKYMTLKI